MTGGKAHGAGKGMSERSRLFLIIGALLLIATIAGCTAFGGGRNENQYLADNAKYFKGTRGIDARFSNMPTTLYYYGPQDNANNEFTFGVEVQNRGASYSRGGIYLSGYDPDLIAFEGLNVKSGAVGACGIGIGTIGFGELGGIFRCGGVAVGSSGSVTNVRIDSLGNLINTLGNQFGKKKTYWDTSKFDTRIDFTRDPTGTNFLLNFDRGQIEYFQHGRIFIAFLAGIDFRKNFGREFLLAGNTYEFPGGEQEYFAYNGKITDWPQGLDKMDFTMMLTSCYQYTTYADPIVCIDPDPTSDHRKVCYPRSRTWSGGQGAPVAVTSVEQENTPRKIIFRLNIKNVGTGTVYDPGQLEKCSPYSPDRATAADMNVIYLGDVRVGNTGLRTSAAPLGMDCSPNPVRLDPKTRSGSTTCTYPINPEYQNIKSAYQTPLIIELWYGYSETQRYPMRIKRLT